jgi:molybdate transport system substrate-binding protein
MHARISALFAALLTALAVAGCGDGGAGERDELVVSAATSLKSAFTSYAGRLAGAEVRFSFAGSDELAAQIRAGARPDVFAAANTTLPEQLFADGLVERPQVFAANRLVLAVPSRSAKVRSFAGIRNDGVTLVIGAPGVPIGAYTRALLRHLDGATRRRILANVRSNEPDVGGIAAKLTQGAADGGFLYATDVGASGGRLKAIELPRGLQQEVAYAVAIVKGAPNRSSARAFVAGLRDGAGSDALRAAGFTPASTP